MLIRVIVCRDSKCQTVGGTVGPKVVGLINGLVQKKTLNNLLCADLKPYYRKDKRSH